MKFKTTLLILLLTFFFSATAQDKEVVAGPTYIGTSSSMRVAPSIASRAQLTLAVDTDKEMMDGRATRSYVIPGKGSKGDDVLAKNPGRLHQKIPGRAPLFVFESGASNAQPTDPTGAVGPNHYVATFNTAYNIFNKSGTLLAGPLSPTMLGFSSGFCCDQTISYDNAADKWVASILYSSDGHVEVAVSSSGNPLTATWNVYSYTGIQDYQKISVWSDGYYMTTNSNSATAGTSNVVYALERDAMLAGAGTAQIIGFPLPGITTFGFYSPQALNVSNNDLPAIGSAPIVYFQDDSWGAASDHLKIWEIDVNWVTPGMSMITTTPDIALTPFESVFDGGGFSNLTQPGGGVAVDALQATLMNQAQFRKFGTHNSAVFNFVVDTDGTAGEIAGIRWVELRQPSDGAAWTLFQEGTYTSPDGKHAWGGSIMMDGQGNIGMGYTGMGGTTNTTLSSYYTGRFAADPMGTMSIAEQLILGGDANIPSTRYADYTKIDVDPVNDKTFWFNTEMMQSGKKNIVGVFQIAPNFNNDVGVVSIDTPVTGALTNSETVTVTVFNFGLNAASGFNVNYQVDGGAIISEAFAGSLASATSAQHVFATTADLSVEGQTYAITSSTVLTGDQDATNDSASANVTHLLANDIGVIAITAPVDGEGLGNEIVTITIENFGTANQSNFDVSYTIDAGTPVVETVPGPVNSGGTLMYSFTAPGDFSSIGTYNLSASTLLAGDGDAGNDTFMTTVTNVNCQSQMETPGTPVGPNAGTITESVITVADDFVLSDVNVTIDITHTYDGDLVMTLIAPDGTEVGLTELDGGNGGDNFTNTTFDDAAVGGLGTGSAPYTGSFQPTGSLADFNGLQSIGDWTFRILDGFSGDGGTFNNWTLQLCSNVNLSVDENTIAEDLVIIHQGNDQYLIKLPTTTVTDMLTLTVTNMLGQKLLDHRLWNENGLGYEYALNMSYVSSGMYMVRIGNDQAGNLKRIIVE